MGSIVVRNMSDEILSALSKQAASEGISREALAKRLLEKAVESVDGAWVDDVAARARQRVTGKKLPKLLDLVLESRNELA